MALSRLSLPLESVDTPGDSATVEGALSQKGCDTWNSESKSKNEEGLVTPDKETLHSVTSVGTKEEKLVRKPPTPITVRPPENKPQNTPL